MSEFRSRLKSLAAMESTYPHILSAYLRLREDGQDVTKKAAIFAKNRASQIESVLAGDSRAQQGLKREFEALQHIIEQDLPKSADGIAVFLRDGDVLERFETNFGFENQLAYRRVPHIAQLAFMDEEMEPFLVVAVDSRSARIFDVTLGVASGAKEIESEVQRRIQAGGWSQMRFQRQIENQKREHIEEVVDQVESIIREFNHKRIVVFGPDKTTSLLVDSLSKSVADRVIERTTLDSRASQGEVMEHALRYFTEAESAEEAEKVRRARVEIHSTGMAVAGIDNVLKYLMRGQAYEVLLAQDFQERGVECRECGSVHHGDAATLGTCPSCDAGKEFLTDLDLREFITRTALNYGVALEYVKDGDFRSSLGGAAAMLFSPAHTSSGRFRAIPE